MRSLAAALKEIAGLFVDDGSLVLMVLGWLGLSAALAHFAPACWDGVVLFLGLAVLLVENARRASRRR